MRSRPPAESNTILQSFQAKGRYFHRQGPFDPPLVDRYNVLVIAMFTSFY
jgi:hypothetical protein